MDHVPHYDMQFIDLSVDDYFKTDYHLDLRHRSSSLPGSALIYLAIQQTYRAFLKIFLYF